MKKRTKKTISISLKLFVRVLLAMVLCAIMYVSMNVIGTAFFSDVVGYQVFEQAEDESVSMITEHYYTDGEKELTASDLELKDNQMFTAIRVVSDNTKGVLDVVSQILMLIVLGIFPYHILWEFGNRDDTNVRYRGQRPDPWRGVKIGLLAISPFFLVWLILFVANAFAPTGLLLDAFKLSSFAYAPYVNWVLGAADGDAIIAWWRLILLLPVYLFVPAVSGISYHFGGHHFSLSEFITFKQKKAETEDEI